MSVAPPASPTPSASADPAAPVRESAPEPVAALARAEVVPPPESADPGQWWAALVTSLPLDGMVRNLAHHAVLKKRDGKHWTLTIDPGHQMLASPERVAELQRIIGQTLNSGVLLNFEAEQGAEGTPAQRAEAARLQKLEQTRAAISQDPVVKALERDFNGRLDIDSIEPD